MKINALCLTATTLLLATAPCASAEAAQCLRPSYVGIQQGNSNIAPPYHTIDYYRSKVVADWRFEAVKVWDRWYGPQDGQFSRLINDPSIDVIVYRPLYESGAPVNLHPRWENIDYGTVADEIYDLYGSVDKVVILTGWEQDHQYYGSGWSYADYLQLLDDRQLGIEAARAAHPGSNLRIYHAVEVNAVPNSVAPGSNNILHQFIPNMTHPPDMISYSAWGGLGNIATKLDVIEAVSGLPRNNIFIGEFGFILNNNSHHSVSNFLTAAQGWGVRLALLWQFNQGPQDEPYQVYPDAGNPGGPGYTTEPGTGNLIAWDTIAAVQSHRDLSKVCALYW